MVGFGTAGGVRKEHIQFALDVGVKLIDSAQATEWYSEQDAAEAIAASGVPRADLFITSKLHPKDLGTKATERAFPRTLSILGSDYIDAFLLHYPSCFGSLCEKEPEGDWKDSWRVLEHNYARGLIGAIGVSNFGLEDLRELYSMAVIKPHIVQNWMDPLHHDFRVQRWCKKHDVQYQSYSTLGTQWVAQMGWNPVLTHPVLKSIARRHDRSIASVVLSWAVQSGVGVIPSSRNFKHIEESASLPLKFLTQSDLREIGNLDGSICRGDPWGCDATPFGHNEL